MKLAVLIPLLLATAATAQECVVPSDKMVGILDRSGTCRGIDKAFALKYSLLSECAAPPKPGHIFWGLCTADFIGQSAPPVNNDLASRIERLEDEVEHLRSK